MSDAEFDAAWKALCSELTRVCRESGRTFVAGTWQQSTGDVRFATTVPDKDRPGLLQHLADKSAERGRRDVPVSERIDS